MSLLTALLPTALAGSGLVVQVVIDGDPVAEPLVISMVSEGGEARIELRDNGQSPDVQRDDGHYSGSGIIQGDSFDVSLTIEGETRTVGPVAWPDDGKPRDLIITMDGELFTIETEAMGPAPGSIDPGAGPTTSTGPSVVAGSSGDVSTVSGGGDDDGTLVNAALAIGGLALLGVVGLWWRGRDDADVPPELPPELVAEASAELLGPGTLTLRPGVQVWTAPASELGEQSQELVSALGQTHRVLYAAPAGAAVAPILGGPVFRMHNTRPAHVADAVQGLVDGPGRPLAVLVRGPVDPKGLKLLEDELPEQVGCVVVAPQ